MTFADLNLTAAYAEVFVLCAACAILLIDAFLSDRQRWITATLTFATLAGAALITTCVAGVSSRIMALNDMFVADPMGDVLKLVTYGAVGVSLLYSREYMTQRELFRGEYYVISLFAMLGIMVIISAASLLTVFLGLELMSLSLYAMVAFNRDSAVSAESAMKYFVLGAISTGVLLYGISILYGVTGTFMLEELAFRVRESGVDNIGLLFGLAFIIVGVAFKFGAVPFHMWIPDVYQGAPTAVTLFVGAAPKIASFALAIRILAEGLGGMSGAWSDMLTVLAVLSMGLGNVVAIAQTNIKRMLAYSAISHVGFILLGILAGTPQGYQAAMYYTIAYVIMAVGSFGMVLLLSRRGFEAEELDDFKGLNARSPWFAAVMLMLMFSTAGVPPFIGFFAKLYVIQAILGQGMTWLAIVAVAFSVIGAFYYIRVIKLMYFDDPQDNSPLLPGSAMKLVLSLNGLAVLALGVVPSGLLNLVARVLPP